MYGVFEAQPSASDSDSGCRKGVGEFFRGEGLPLYRFHWLFLGEAYRISVLSLISRNS